MKVDDTDMLAYLRHRTGEERIHKREQRVIRKALELNEPRPDFDASFGKPDLQSYIGFVDLANFSATVHGKSPEAIANYLRPFLNAVIGILRDRRALIDKTIGDEVMFVLPESEEDGNPPEILFLGQIMGALHDLAFTLGNEYAYRIGISYGKVRFFKVEGKGYSEWTAVGEPIHVAKRLHTLPALRDPRPVIGAFGMQVGIGSKSRVREVMEHRLAMFAGFASRFDHRLADEPIQLKGVGEVLHALLIPRPERATA